MDMDQYLALTILAPDQPHILAQCTQFFATYHCQVHSSRMLVLGESFALLVLLRGSWNEIAKLETHLPLLEQKYNILIRHQRTQLKQHEASKWIPYSVELISHDESGLTEAISTFFSDIGAYIYEMQNNSYISNPQHITMFSLAMRILIPVDIQLSDLREQFVAMCDTLNVDAYLEPERM
jgi:glycine cleavage system transcriptional repressor